MWHVLWHRFLKKYMYVYMYINLINLYVQWTYIFKYFVVRSFLNSTDYFGHSHWLFLDIHHTMPTCTFHCSFLERNSSFLISYMDAYRMMFQAKQMFWKFSQQSIILFVCSFRLYVPTFFTGFVLWTLFYSLRWYI